MSTLVHRYGLPCFETCLWGACRSFGAGNDIITARSNVCRLQFFFKFDNYAQTRKSMMSLGWAFARLRCAARSAIATARPFLGFRVVVQRLDDVADEAIDAGCQTPPYTVRVMLTGYSPARLHVDYVPAAAVKQLSGERIGLRGTHTVLGRPVQREVVATEHTIQYRQCRGIVAVNVVVAAVMREVKGRRREHTFERPGASARQNE